MITIKEFIEKYYGRFSINCYYNPELEKYKLVADKIKQYGLWCSYDPYISQHMYYLPARQCGNSKFLRMVIENVVHK